MNDNSKLAVAALQNGTVIDHIPSHLVFKVVRLLDLENVEGSVTIGYNLDSKKLGKKGILKVSGVTFPEETLNRLALVAPNVNVNIIEDYKVVKKFKVTLADDIVDIVRCTNPKCITNNEPMRTYFNVMAKKVWRPGTMIYPLPAILVGCGNAPENYNLITVAWVGTICSDPAMCYVSVRKERHSYALLKENMEFTLNLTNRDMARAADWCGVRSGRDYDKFAETGLTPRRGMMVQAPYIEEAPLSIECRVKEIIPLGSHDMFISEVLCTLADERFINPETGAFDMQAADLIAYAHGNYYGLGDKIGKFGWSVQKKK